MGLESKHFNRLIFFSTKNQIVCSLKELKNTVLVFFEEPKLAYFAVFRHFRRQKRISISTDESKVDISNPRFVRFTPSGILKGERIVVVFELFRRAPQVASFLGVFGVLGHGDGTV